jgi:replicative DNA helicase
MTHSRDISPLTRLIGRLDRAAAGDIDQGMVPSSFPSIDRAMGGGFRRGELIVLGADDSAGASSLALAIALRCAGRPLYLTGEMRPERAYERALAMAARVPLETLRLGVITEEERTRLATAAVALREQAPIVETLVDGGLAAVERAVVAAAGGSGSVPLVVVDPLEALLDRATDHAEALGYALLGLKRLALRHDCALLVTAHLPQLDRTRLDRRPRLADFGLAGAVGTHADIVLGLYREELYEVADLGVTGGAELLVLKLRDGARGYVDLYFDARYGRFEDVLEG